MIVSHDGPIILYDEAGIEVIFFEATVRGNHYL